MRMITYMKIKHHSIFNNLNSDQINWNKIRNDPSEKEYFIPIDKSDYIKEANFEDSYKEIINEILLIIQKFKINSIFSLGSGRAYLEYKLKQKNIPIIISDSDDSMDRIKNFNIFNGVYKLSFTDVFSEIKNFQGLILMSRIDTELSDNELIIIFNRLSKIKVRYIYFIPAQLLTFKSLIVEIYIRIKSIIFRKKLIYCGYSRSEKLMSQFWKKHYTHHKMPNSKSFLLELR